MIAILTEIVELNNLLAVYRDFSDQFEKVFAFYENNITQCDQLKDLMKTGATPTADQEAIIKTYINTVNYQNLYEELWVLGQKILANDSFNEGNIFTVIRSANDMLWGSAAEYYDNITELSSRIVRTYIEVYRQVMMFYYFYDKNNKMLDQFTDQMTQISKIDYTIIYEFSHSRYLSWQGWGYVVWFYVPGAKGQFYVSEIAQAFDNPLPKVLPGTPGEFGTALDLDCNEQVAIAMNTDLIAKGYYKDGDWMDNVEDYIKTYVTGGTPFNSMYVDQATEPAQYLFPEDVSQ